MQTLQKWILIGTLEIVICLGLISIAPIFINSKHPIVGLLIWLGVLALLGSSGLWLISRLSDAATARALFVQAFPEYRHLGIPDFLNVSSRQMAHKLEVFKAAKDDPDFQTLKLSPLDLLRSSKHE